MRKVFLKFNSHQNLSLSSVLQTSGEYKSSSNCFLFSFRNKDNLSPFKSHVYRNSNNAIYTAVTRGPNFGGGHDIYIPKNAKTSTGSTNFGHTYRPPSGYGYGNSNTQALLAGSYNFYATEIEVYYFA